MLNPTIIASIFTGLAGLVVAWTQLRAQRSGMTTSELREGRRERKRLEAQLLGIRRWAIRCEQTLIEKLGRAPKRPPEMDLDWGLDSDDEEPKSPVRLVSR